MGPEAEIWVKKKAENHREWYSNRGFRSLKPGNVEPVSPLWLRSRWTVSTPKLKGPWLSFHKRTKNKTYLTLRRKSNESDGWFNLRACRYTYSISYEELCNLALFSEAGLYWFSPRYLKCTSRPWRRHVPVKSGRGEMTLRAVSTGIEGVADHFSGSDRNPGELSLGFFNSH